MRPQERQPAEAELRGLARHAVGLVALTYFLLVFGASVRVHGAGLACPDWPLCFGRVVPPIDFGVALEFGHRVVAGVVSLGFLWLGARVWTHRAALGATTWRLVVLAAAVLALQVVLGGLTVLELLAEWTVTSHLLAGNTFCLTLLLVALRVAEARRPVDRAPVGAGLRAASVGLAVLVAGQLALGGLVSSSHAGLACGTWPTCDGTTWFPTFSGLVGLQVTHRIMAYLVLAAGLVPLALTGGRGRAGRAAWLVFGAILLQATIGISNVLLRMPVEITLAHTAGAAAVVLSTTWLAYEAWRAPLGASHVVPRAPAVAEEGVA